VHIEQERSDGKAYSVKSNYVQMTKLVVCGRPGCLPGQYRVIQKYPYMDKMVFLFAKRFL
jgi:hypothetical protein